MKLGLSVLLFACALQAFVLGVQAQHAVQCRGENGDPVDWFLVLKQPDGSSYAYADPDHALQESPWTLDDLDGGAISSTLKQLYQNRSTLGYGLWSDQPWGSKDSKSTNGHTKGVVAFEKASMFVLTHSVPRWPNIGQEYTGYPDPQKSNGQSFLCLSMSPASSLAELAELQRHSYPYWFDASMPEELQSAFPEYASVMIEHSHYGKKDGKTLQKASLKTFNNVKFDVIAKTRYYDIDLFHGVIAPTFSSAPLLVQTWRNGSGGALPSNCTDPPTENVAEIAIGGKSWPYTKDHSKWAVTDDAQIGCIASLNRVSSQEDRGGIAFCTNAHQISSALRSSISQVEQC